MSDEKLKSRIEKAKNTLKDQGHTQILPVYKFLYKDSDQAHLNRVQNCLQGKITDQVITERIEDMADQV